MAIREKINEHKHLAAGIAVTCFVLLGVVVWLQLRAVPLPPKPQAFYTVDDGQTLFEDEIGRVVPFDRDGKEAVRAYVFTEDGGETRVVGYLEKFTPEAVRSLTEAGDPTALRSRQTSGSRSRGMALSRLAGGGRLVKKPGAGGEWVPMDDARAAQIRKPPTPNSVAIVSGEDATADDAH